jgi:hypothetical protein
MAARERPGSRPRTPKREAISDAELTRTLAVLQRAIFKYPMAVQAAFETLVAEGRSFAQTDEGRDWQERLLRAKQTGRLRMVWEVLSLGAFTERSDGLLPSVFVDSLVRTLTREHLEPLLSRVFERRF